jgi:hypothetical protein
MHEAAGIIFARPQAMFKTITQAASKVRSNEITEAFNKHLPVKVTKLDGQTLGPGYIAIMYGPVAFRMYPNNAGETSHFVRVDEIAELTIG